MTKLITEYIKKNTKEDNEKLKEIIHSNSFDDDMKEFMLYESSKYGNLDIFSLLFNKNIINENSKQYFLYAAKNGHKDIVNIFLEANSFDNNLYNSAISFAAQYKQLNICKLLLDSNNVTPITDYNVFFHPSLNGFLDIVELLYNKGFNPCAESNVSIINADAMGHTDIVLFLWKDQMVKKTLKNDQLELYYTLIKMDIKDKANEF